MSSLRLDLFQRLTEIPIPKPKTETPPARCPECGEPALKGTTPDGHYCSSEECEWFGDLDAFCDCCDAPMEGSTCSVEAYGIETYACPTCRNVEY